jgi:hypothetical protein
MTVAARCGTIEQPQHLSERAADLKGILVQAPPDVLEPNPAIPRSEKKPAGGKVGGSRDNP